MDSARFLLAIVLMIAVIVITNLIFAPAPRPTPEPPAVDTVTQLVPEPVPVPVPVPVPEPVAPPVVRPVEEPVVGLDTVVVGSPLYRYGVSTGGGSIVSAELLLFPSFTQPGPVQLVPETVPSLISYRLRVGERIVELGERPFQAEPADSLVVPPDAAAPLRLDYRDAASELGVELTYEFDADHYLFRASGRVLGAGAAPAQLLIDLGPTLLVNEADPREDERALAYVINGTRQGIQSVDLRSVRETRIEEGPLVWVSLKNKYFLAALLSDGPERGGYFGGVIAEPAPGEHTAELTATLPIARDGSFSFEIYLGPQEYSRLAEAGRGLEDVNPYGWRVLRPIIRPLAHLITWALVGLHNVLDISYGWVLVLFGVLIRIVLWPLNARAMRSQLRNMELQPRLKEIQEKYKAEPEKLQKEMIRLYREEGFNPLGGCLPLLIPFPVLITLFFVFQATIEFRGVSFLWLPDLSRPDPYYILPLLLGASMFLLQKLSMGTAPPNPQMKMMLWFMPILMVVIFLNLASGLIVYYAAMNVATIPQQLQLIKERRKLQARTAAA